VSVPKRRTSHMRVRTRRAHDALKPISLAECPRCKQALRPHTVCGNCGWYRDGTVIDVEAEQEQ
jgi:large subunit ribosomal protein L32